MTKSGKTVLVKRIFPKNEVIWIDGGHIGSEEDLWSAISIQHDSYAGNTTEADIISVRSKSRISTLRTIVARSLQGSLRPIIIDDFHYLDKELQAQVIRFLKPVILEGAPVIIIAIPHTRYDTVKVEREMTGRVRTIDVPAWKHDELLQIAKVGFPLLNMHVEDIDNNTLVQEALGSPHLMQEFCLELCRKEGVIQTEFVLTKITPSDYLDELFHKVAEDTSRTMFEKLAKGPRKRTDRNERKLKDGKVTDIYGLVLKALSNLQPGTDTIQNDSIRNSIKQILLDDTPKTHEISRVIERMADIAASDATSAPVIEWNKTEQELHIIDPFFAYYLKWGQSNE